MSHLCSLDTIAFCQLNKFLDYVHVVRLLMTGNGLLQQRLCDRHVVTHVSVVLPEGNIDRLLPSIANSLRHFKYVIYVALSAPHLENDIIPIAETLNMFSRSLPPRLNTLKISFRLNLMQDFFEALPKSLKSLDLTGAGTCILNASLSSLPKKLVRLDIGGVRSLTRWHPLQDLPLRYLNLSSAWQFDDEDVKHLPRTLTRLNLTEAYRLTDKAIPQLPNDLVHLSLGSSHFTESAISCLPRSVLYLYLCRHVSLRDFCLQDLPPQLLVLTIGLHVNPDHPGTFLFMPRSLLFLTLFCRVTLKQEHVANLPNLQRLSIYSSTFCVDAQAVKQLPKTLISLTLNNTSNIGDLWVQHLPHSLLFMHWHKDVLTDQCVAHLPPKLVICNLYDNTTITDTGYEQLSRVIPKGNIGAKKLQI